MSEKIVDMNLARTRKIAAEVAGEHQRLMDPNVAECVPIIGCANCSGATFELTNDKRVICATCHHLISSIRWFPVDELSAPVA